MKKYYLQPKIKVMAVHHESLLLVDSVKVSDDKVSDHDNLLVSP